MGKYQEVDCRNKLSSFQYFFYDYGRFHGNTVNILIHLTCIPTIVITSYLLTEFLSTSYFKISFNFGALILSTWGLLYLTKELFLGLVTIAEYVGIFYYLHGRDLSCCNFNHLQIVLGLFVTAWILQFIGHGVFERRAPALVTNLLLTINAPLFVNIEIFYYAFGYRKGDIDEAKKYIAQDIKNYLESGKSAKD